MRAESVVQGLHPPGSHLRGQHHAIAGARVRLQLGAALAAATIVATTVPSLLTAQVVPAQLEQFLVQTVGLDPDEMRAVASGSAVVRSLESSDRREVALFGVVRIDVPRPFYLSTAVDFRALPGDSGRAGFGLFSDPASAADVTAFTLPHDDVEELKRCVPAACKVKLSEGAISALRARLDSASSADAAADAFFRATMVDYVTAYRAHGDSALIVYNDRRDAVAAAEVFDAILSRSPWMYRYAPSLERYLRNYPRGRPSGIEEALFWSQDELPGLRSTLSLKHRVVYTPPESGDLTLIADKLLYANHYLDGALDLTSVVDQSTGVYVIRLWRLHFDYLRSGPINVHGKVSGELRDRLEVWLADAKTRAENARAGAR